MVPSLKMMKWSQQIEEEITQLLKDWLKSLGKTQKDLRNSLFADSERMSSLLNSLKKEYSKGGLPYVVSKLCEIEEDWSNTNEALPDGKDKLDPFSQLDLLLEELNEDCEN